MFVLARKVGQSIIINDNIELVVIEVRGDQVRLGISAPKRSRFIARNFSSKSKLRTPEPRLSRRWIP